MQSSNILQSMYDDKTQLLHVQFWNFAIYRYHNVPPAVVDSFFQTSSPKSFLDDKIKGRYPCVSVKRN
jgi:hypothetical protein